MALSGPQMYKFFSLAFCWLGIAYQSWQTSQSYFSYPVQSLITIDSESWNLPAIGICPASDRGPYAEKLANLTMDERAQVLPTTDEYFDWCRLTLPNSSNVDCSSVTNFRTFTGPIGRCFIFFERRDLFLSSSGLMYDPIDLLPSDLFAAQISSPLDAPRSWMFRMYPPTDYFLFTRKDLSKIWFEMPINKMMSVQYSYLHTIRLEAPYPDACFNYRKTKFLTRDKAFDDCFIRTLSNLTSGSSGYIKSWPYVAFFEANLTYIEESKGAYEQNGNVSSVAVPQALQMCTEKFMKNDCDRLTYEVLQEANSRPALLNNTEVIIRVPGLPKRRLKVELTPFFLLLDYINSMGGIANLWINFALYSFLSGLVPAVKFKSNNQSMLRIRKQKIIQYIRRTRKKIPTTDTHQIILKILSRLILLVCCAGCLYQSFDIAMIYVENNFYFWVLSIQPELVELPRFTFCVARVIEDEKMARFYPEIYEKVPRSEWEDKLTIDQMFDLTIDLDDILQVNSSTFVSRVNMTHVPIVEFYKIDKLLTDRYTCFSTFAHEQYIYPVPLEKYKYSQLAHSMYFIILLKQLPINLYPSLYIFSHVERSIRLEPASNYKITLKNKRSGVRLSLALFSVKEVKVILVSHNVQSQCHEYKEITSQEDAINDCVTSILTKSKLWPLDVPVTLEQSKGLRFANSSNQEDYETAWANCSKKYSTPPCEQRFLATSIEDIGINDGNDTILFLYPSKEDYREIRQEIKYSIVDLIIFVGGLINFWTGLAVLSVVELPSQLFNSNKKHFHSTDPSLQRF